MAVPSAARRRSLLLFAVFLGALVTARVAFVELYLVASDSMEETLVDGDFVLVDKTGFSPLTRFVHGGTPPVEAGDLALYRIEGGDPEIRVKRVVGAPGDTLEMRQGRLRRNGEVLEEAYAWKSLWPTELPTPPMQWHRRYRLGDAPDRGGPTGPDDWGPIVLPPGQYFLLGDHRARSVDSRHHGPVAGADLMGRPILVVFSYGRRTAKPLPWLQAIRTVRIGPVR